tara:strand:- start:22 stop:309 length:288 start_codon:yes stop_codon:yes gene_type:complete
MSLELPIPVQFSIKMETDKAYIVSDLKLQDNLLCAETNLPKMYTEVKSTNKDDVTLAVVENWVLEQRVQEARSQSVDNAISKLIELSQQDVSLQF